MANIQARCGRHITVCMAAIVGVVLFSAGSSIALGKGKKKNNNNNNSSQQPTSQPMNPQIMAAQQQLQNAQHALAAATDAFKAKYEVGDQWKSAADAQKAAQKALSREHEAVLEKLADTDAYKAVENKKEQAAADLQAAHDDPADADPQHTAELATAVSNATQEKSKLETDALATDPDYAATQSKLQAANKTMSDLQAQEKSAMQQDPSWQTAHQNLLTAQAAYDKLVE